MPDGPALGDEPDLAPHHAALEAWFCAQTGVSDLKLGDITLLPGGAVQRNWRLDLQLGDQVKSVVLRAGPDIALPESRPKAHEYAVLQVAYEFGMPVAEPLWLEPTGAVIGREFMVSGHRPGDADRARLFANPARKPILEHLAGALAGIHALPVPDALVAEAPHARVASLQGWARDLADVPKGVMVGLDWLEENAPAATVPGIVHRDFRTGNFLIEAQNLSAILDWEFAGAGDIHEDIGWFCARCWRGENTQNEAGGLGARDGFYRAYMEAGGVSPEPTRVHFWEVFAHTRWALIAMQQGARAVAGEYPVWELEEAGNRVPGLSVMILELLNAR